MGCKLRQLVGISLSLAAFAPSSIGAQQIRWTVDPKPTFDLGAESGDTLDTFADVRGVTRLANGDVVVADNKYFTLRYFTADGKFRRSVGRKGEGPGEFESIIRMLRCGDSLFVQRWSSPLWHVFHVNGTFKRNMTMVSPQVKWNVPYHITCNGGGQFLSNGWEDSKDRKAGTYRSIVPFWLNTPDGAVKKTVVELQGDERLAIPRPDGSIGGSGPMPLGKASVLAIGKTRVYIGTADSNAINVYDLEGKTLGLLRTPIAGLRTTPEDIARTIALDTTGKSAASIKTTLERSKQTKYPATLPTYAALVIDSDDNLWVQSYPRANEKVSHWTIFSPSGTLIAFSDLPVNLEVSEIGRDYVLGITRDPPDEIQHVKVYRLRK